MFYSLRAPVAAMKSHIALSGAARRSHSSLPLIRAGAILAKIAEGAVAGWFADLVLENRRDPSGEELLFFPVLGKGEFLFGDVALVVA